MNYELLLHQSVESDIREGKCWVEKYSSGQGGRFERAFYESLAAILARPESFPLIDEIHRRAKIKDFRFGVLFRVANDRVAILGVQHDSQDLTTFLSRSM